MFVVLVVVVVVVVVYCLLLVVCCLLFDGLLFSSVGCYLMFLVEGTSGANTYGDLYPELE